MKNLHKLLKGEHILGLTNVHFEKNRICSTCQAGKQVGVYHPHKNIMTTERPLELLHMDLLKDFLRRRASSMSSLLPTHLNKMVLWRERIELYWTWQGPCLMSTRHRIGFGRRQLTLLATLSTDSTITESSRKHHINSSPVKSPMFLILEFLGANALYLLREVEF
jgi:hypothetical protein